ncbi:VOC family protein [Planomicrobium sp. CPCC 101079]|uniref:VOC family protein n=1 Tax=Planomicrobium sp. CPCC 101079 TaxID=2599618 RepID=UPI0011B85711|nr:VOC family protein [Planomicrobium sp. CPCC 101079]TWT16143.1 hypothetical protein FQV28_00205 [Planomicrobium sp. CPCC 101079]
MLHHVEINASNLPATREFYDDLLPDLGYELYQEWPRGFSYKHSSTYLVFVQTENEFLHNGYNRKATGLNHLAFHAKSRQQVDELTGKMRRKCVKVLYEDRHPFAGGSHYYALFIEGPDRLKIEIVAPE